MSFYRHLTEFAGRPVVDFPADPARPTPAEAADPSSAAWRLDCSKDGEYHDRDFPELLADFLERVPSTAVEALVTGQWLEWGEDDCTVVDDLVAVADRLPALRALFVNDLIDEQSQPSWIYVPQLDPLLDAFPSLTELWVRGTPEGMARGDIDPLIQPVKHAALRKLVLQSGGLPETTIRALAQCEFPELTHLEIYLGDPNYGGNATLEDLAPFLEPGRFPRLRHLGLKDAMIQDQIAAAIAQAPIVAQLESLDLSLGTLGDEGAAALLAGQPLDHLRRLDLSHHYLSAAMQARVRQAWPGVEIDLSDEREADRWRRYIAVAE